MGNMLYNGVELPDISAVWDKTTYPYAYISTPQSASELFGVEGAVWMLFLSSNRAAFISEHPIVAPAFTGKTYMATYDQAVINALASIGVQANIGEWTFGGEESSDSYNWVIGDCSWASHDILKADNSVYLAGSDPVPVGGIPDVPDAPDAPSKSIGGWAISDGKVEGLTIPEGKVAKAQISIN